MAMSRRTLLGLVILLSFLSLVSQPVSGYVFNGYTWPTGSTVNFELGITGPSSGRLQDGSANFNASAADALSIWNQHIDLIKFSWAFTGVPGAQRDGHNQAFFASSVYGQSFGGAIAVTIGWSNGGNINVETDTMFSTAELWDSYRGPIQHNNKKKKYIYDLHRTALHEFGHVLGLDHPDQHGQSVVAIMNSVISNLDSLAADDIAGAHALYDAAIFGGSPPAVQIGDQFSYQILANNSPTSYTATSLPSGLSLNSSTGVISGTPTVAGVFDVRVTATGARATATGVLRIIVIGPEITSSLFGNGNVGVAFSYQITATNNPSGYDATGLPAGLTLNRMKGVISGTPTSAGNYTVNLVAHTIYGDANASILLVVSPPQITSDFQPYPVEVGNHYSYFITATGNPTGFQATALPAGLNLNLTTGEISGTPTVSGNFSVVVTAHEAAGDASATIIFTFSPRQITSSMGNVVLDIGSSYTYRITADNTPTSFSVANLPSGLTLDSRTGVITGVVTLSGNVSFDIVAHGSFGDAMGTVSLTVQPLRTANPPLAFFPDYNPIKMVVDSVRPRGYVLMDYARIVVLDTANLAIVQTIQLSHAVGDIAISSDNSQLLMATNVYSSGYHAVDRLDLTSLMLLPSVPLSFPPGQVRGGLNNRLYVTDADNFNGVFNINQVDGGTGALQRVVASSKIGTVIEISADRRTLYAALATGGGGPTDFFRFDVSNVVPIQQKEHVLPDLAPLELILSSTGKYISPYSNQNAGLELWSTADLATSHGLLGNSGLSTIAYSSDDSIGYVGNYFSSSVEFRDLSDLHLLSSIEVDAPGVQEIAVDNSGSTLFILAPAVWGNSGILAYSARTNPQVTPPHSLLNVSTRMMVGTGDNVEIGGFIITGTKPKKVAVRAVAPSLAQKGVSGALTDPVLELHDGTGAVAVDDNWNLHRQDVLATGLAPSDEHESVIVATLKPGGYSAILRGVNSTTGVALVEVFDIDPQNSKLANISTRGNVGTGDNVMIGGFIIGGDQPTRVVVRALGPSLASRGVSNSLADPTLELHDGNGAVIYQNDNWKSSQQSAIQASGLAPAQDSEAAILATLNSGGYSAIVRGKNNTTGIALVEVFNLD